jgi:hypothetical protein
MPKIEFIPFEKAIVYICRECKKVDETFFSIDFQSLTGWCSLDCFTKEGLRIEEEIKRSRSGLRARMPMNG